MADNKQQLEAAVAPSPPEAVPDLPPGEWGMTNDPDDPLFGVKGTIAFVTGGAGFLGRRLIRNLVHYKAKKVIAIVRSEESANVIRQLGGTVVLGDIGLAESMVTMQQAMENADFVFHCAANVNAWGDYDEIYRDTVTGTENVLKSAKAAKVKRFVHCGTEAVLVVGKDLVNVNEDYPIPDHPKSFPYSRTKALAEKLVLSYNSPEMTTVVCRPRFIWGADDTKLLPQFIKAAKSGDLKWFNGGYYRTSHCNVQNVVEGMILAAFRGRSGGVYFLTDGPPTQFKVFMSRLLLTNEQQPPTADLPYWAIQSTAYALETAWWVAGFFKKISTPPLITRQSLYLMAREITVDDTRARNELQYKARFSVDLGFKEMELDYQVKQKNQPK